MCMQVSAVRPYQKWRWAGDEVVLNTRIPASREIPGTGIRRFDMDIRAFLGRHEDAVVRHFLERFVQALPAKELARFVSAQPGSYDFRAIKVTGLLRQTRYVPSSRDFDSWLLPDETLGQGGGDCEDLSFLTLALLEEAGISRQCLRVALGYVVDHSRGEPLAKAYDHAWVLYLTEGGGWIIIDPVTIVKDAIGSRSPVARGAKGRHPGFRAKSHRHDIEYIPQFVFNRDNLWRVHGALDASIGEPPSWRAAVSARRRDKNDLRAYLGKRDQFWKKYDPSFAVNVHNDIFDAALTGMPSDDLATVKLHSFWIDANVFRYDPRDHFDFAYIDEGWERVRNRLNKANKKASEALEDFAYACHSIADFYAHSLYAHFAPRDSDGKLPVYGGPIDAIDNDFLFDRFDLPGCQKTREAAKDYWKGRLLSGQWWRWYTTYPSDLKGKEELAWRRCLPDHDAVAVDSKVRGSDHLLYPTDAAYTRQFQARKEAAIEHIRREYARWK